jgi:hypothetical protein
MSEPTQSDRDTGNDDAIENDDDDLIDRLIVSNAEFRALLEKANASPRKPFVPREFFDD